MSGVRQSILVGDVLLELDLLLEDGRLTGTIERDDATDDVAVHVERAGPQRIRIRTGDRVSVVTVFRDGDVRHVSVDGDVFLVRDATSRRGAEATGQDAAAAVSPMTGVVVKVDVTPGDAVPKGESLFVVEAMKMEYVVRAPRDIVVAGVTAEAGAAVDLDEVLVTFADDA